MKARVLRVNLREKETGLPFPGGGAQFELAVVVTKGTPEWDALWAAGLNHGDDYGLDVTLAAPSGDPS